MSGVFLDRRSEKTLRAILDGQVMQQMRFLHWSHIRRCGEGICHFQPDVVLRAEIGFRLQRVIVASVQELSDVLRMIALDRRAVRQAFAREAKRCDRMLTATANAREIVLYVCAWNASGEADSSL
jgi:hypothetical protein